MSSLKGSISKGNTDHEFNQWNKEIVLKDWLCLKILLIPMKVLEHTHQISTGEGIRLLSDLNKLGFKLIENEKYDLILNIWYIMRLFIELILWLISY
jgi:hypothetical protein